MKRTLVLLLAAASFPALADRYVVPKHAAFEEECASCHMAYPPQMLDAHSWQHLMNNLPKHFGTDASLDEKRRVAIADFLGKNAGGRKTGVTADAKGNPLIRITETERFVRKHRQIADAVWQRPAIKSKANCTACHTTAAEGNYSDDNVRIPR